MMMAGGGGGGRGGGGAASMIAGGMGDFALVLLDMPAAGTRVKKGDVVAEFDRVNMLNRIDDYEDAVKQAELNIQNSKARLTVSREAHQQSVRAAKSDMEKAQLDLETIPVVSEIQAERIKLAAEETSARYKQLLNEVPLLEISQKSDLRNAEVALATSKIELQKAVTNAEKMLLKAPMDGIVVMQSMRRGQEMAQVEKGDQVFPGMVFMQVVDPSSMVLNATVNQVDAEALRIGMKATVRIDAYPGLELPGRVTSIGAVTVAQRRPNFMRQIPVRLALDKTDPRVLPDLSASAEIVLETAEKAAVVPLASVFQDGGNGKPYVYVRSGQAWQRREVELGVRGSLTVAVKSGIANGEVVALEKPPAPADGKPSS
jgi:multidrug resistance efflux pump